MPKLCEPNFCTGCTACAAICPRNCIAMAADTDGFLHPAVDESSCVGCGLCERICPVLNRQEPSHMPTACAVKSQDEASRLLSTSGGVFPELARNTLEHGGAVYGAAYDDRFRVVHICAEHDAQLDRLRGAKYAQSDLRGIFRDVKRRLELGQQVLFSGTPCQVLGLRSYLQRDYENLLLVDLVCHSVPSPLAWERYLEYISGGRQLTAVNLRCKDTGWSRYRYCNRFEFADGTSRTDPSGESLYMKLFGGGYIIRPACAACPAKGYARVSDLTLGDFWGIWSIAPDMDDDKGTSVVFVHTEKGRTALARMEQRAVTLEEASRENPAILRSVSANPLREQVMEQVRKGTFEAVTPLISPPATPKKTSGPIQSFLRRVIRFVGRKFCSAF